MKKREGEVEGLRREVAWGSAHWLAFLAPKRLVLLAVGRKEKKTRKVGKIWFKGGREGRKKGKEKIKERKGREVDIRGGFEKRRRDLHRRALPVSFAPKWRKKEESISKLTPSPDYLLVLLAIPSATRFQQLFSIAPPSVRGPWWVANRSKTPTPTSDKRTIRKLSDCAFLHSGSTVALPQVPNPSCVWPEWGCKTGKLYKGLSPVTIRAIWLCMQALQDVSSRVTKICKALGRGRDGSFPMTVSFSILMHY